MTSNDTTQYDYIFTGVGLAALMTAYKMTKVPFFKDKKILLLNEHSKNTNDRTWCFWSTEPSLWDKAIAHHWDQAKFACCEYERNLILHPYQYYMIRGIDFYQFVLKELEQHSNFTFIPEKVIAIEETENQVFVQTNSYTYYGRQILNSIYDPTLALTQKKYPLLQQHFIGWTVLTKKPVFNPEVPTFMDFSVAQKGNTRFMYVLPNSPTEALVEYTLFSANLLPKEEYETEIKNYLENLGVSEYTIVEKEQGNIPMTCYPFWKANTKKVAHIGTAGGWTKASTGYTFKNSDKKSSTLVDFMIKNQAFTGLQQKTKFWWYDRLLLDILYSTNEIGSTIFSSLFQKGNPSLIFKFLDEETTLSEDLQVILKCPKIPFLKALFKLKL